MHLPILWRLAVLALAAPTPQNSTPRRDLNTAAPRMRAATYVANVTDPALTRDSCGSARIGDRVLWTCRDTQAYDASSGTPRKLPIVTNSAAWTNLSDSGGPALAAGPIGAASDGVKPILQMYGTDALTSPAYFPLQDIQCPSSGVCEDGTRYVVWQDQPPLITQQSADGSAVGYTWIPSQQLQGVNNLITPNPFYSLYKTAFTPSTDANAVRKAELVSSSFYGENEIGYGRYGSMLYNNTAYLYGQTADQQTVLARVPADRVEDRTAYEYYRTGSQSWVSTSPVFNSSASTASTPSASSLPSNSQSCYTIPNAGYGGQGTFYYSSHFSCFVWIGQSIGLDGSSAIFYITTAPAPEGPWIEPTLLFEGESGDHSMVGGYTLQAHPSLLPSGPGVASEKGIYLSWTQQWNESTVGSIYVTPLVWLEFE